MRSIYLWNSLSGKSLEFVSSISKGKTVYFSQVMQKDYENIIMEAWKMDQQERASKPEGSPIVGNDIS